MMVWGVPRHDLGHPYPAVFSPHAGGFAGDPAGGPHGMSTCPLLGAFGEVAGALGELGRLWGRETHRRDSSK